MKKSTSQIKVIQALRGIAAIAVMWYHKRDFLKIEDYPLGEWLVGKGGMGVDLFFVISGFIMVKVASGLSDKYSNQIHAGVDFWIKRFTRIMPIYIFVTLLFSFLVWHNFDFLEVDKLRLFKSFTLQPLHTN